MQILDLTLTASALGLLATTRRLRVAEHVDHMSIEHLRCCTKRPLRKVQKWQPYLSRLRSQHVLSAALDSFLRGAGVLGVLNGVFSHEACDDART